MGYFACAQYDVLYSEGLPRSLRSLAMTRFYTLSALRATSHAFYPLSSALPTLPPKEEAKLILNRLPRRRKQEAIKGERAERHFGVLRHIDNFYTAKQI